MENLRNRTTSHGFFISGRKNFKAYFFEKKTELKNWISRILDVGKKEIGTLLLMFTQSAYVSYVHKKFIY